MFGITCPRCQATITVRDSDAGQKIACPCGQRLLVPQPPPNKTVLAPLAGQSVTPIEEALSPPANPFAFDKDNEPAAKSSGMAIASLVLGIVGLAGFCLYWLAVPSCLIGIALGIVAKFERPRPSRKYQTMATAGIMLSIAGLFAVAALFAFVLWLHHQTVKTSQF